MTQFIANARMYAVTPAAERAWRELVGHVAREAHVALDYLPYPAPQPLEILWRREDLGAVQMCGYPIAMSLANVIPVAAPIPALDWAGGRAVYRSDFIVRADSAARTLADTFGGRIGWTVTHSHSGFNAPRHHLLRYRTAASPTLYRESVGNLVTARRILDGVLDGSIDVGPLDGYWHALIRRHAPELTAGVRIVESTDLAPMPAFVAAPALPADDVTRLRAAFAAAATRPWFPGVAETLLLAGFSAVGAADFETTVRWDADARAAGYAVPG